MRILFLTTIMGMGGADQQLLTIVDGLRARGHAVMIVSLASLGPMGLKRDSSAFPRSPCKCGGVFPIHADWFAWPGWCEPGGRTCSTATWSMPTSWPGR